MKFLNETEYSAHLFRSEYEEDRLHNSLLVRMRYKLVDHSHLIPLAGEEELDLIRREDIEEEDYGTLTSDSFYPRTGTDLIILGDAIVPEIEESAPFLKVKISAGSPEKEPIYNLNLIVFGVRDLQLEEILIDLRHSMVDLSYRKLFDYDFVRHQTRKTTLHYIKNKER